jgi:hypothetical protein
LATQEEGFGGALDLSGVDFTGFTPLDAGTYDCELFEYKWTATKGGANAKLPEGTPRLNVTTKVIEPEFEGRRFWDGFNIPPADYDADKRAQALGFLGRFLKAMGLEEDAIKTKKFNLNAALDELIGEPVRVTVKVEPQRGGANDGEMRNVVVGYKSMEEATAGSDGKLL